MTKRQLAVPSGSFGFVPHESTHHFVVHIPRGAAGNIDMSEHFAWDEQHGSGEVSYGSRLDGQIRVVLPRLKWDMIADPVRSHFALRLRHMGLRSGSWRAGQNLLRRELGKELVLLAWAIEDADPSFIPTAIANWSGLSPEERWWLYTQTAAATGHGIADRGRGWRKAVRYALTENPVTSRASDEAVVPAFFRLANAGPMFAHEPETMVVHEQHMPDEEHEDTTSSPD
ncbi:DUF3780 domain-containing protein [Candidatus Chloroploca sp. Khr17]|uniref:DUF3780 domain-containing protein n=1 Tax=Candidatus Chloroploca sp. Khr17 TaxID=2496869 RepID=UPI00101D43BD|nr:DUF3780 domain-containing protein [Candidatus Chloroploca sp. Khr17]